MTLGTKRAPIVPLRRCVHCAGTGDDLGTPVEPDGTMRRCRICAGRGFVHTRPRRPVRVRRTVLTPICVVCGDVISADAEVYEVNTVGSTCSLTCARVARKDS